MSLDAPRLIRIRAAVQAVGESPSTSALVELYRSSRNQVLSMLDDEDLRQEFESLIPAWRDEAAPRRGVVAGALVAPTVGRSAATARLRLRTLVGWIDGLVESMRYEAQIAANAEAYARETVKAERGMGFRSKA